jgi:hypothetical protein
MTAKPHKALAVDRRDKRKAQKSRHGNAQVQPGSDTGSGLKFA